MLLSERGIMGDSQHPEITPSMQHPAQAWEVMKIFYCIDRKHSDFNVCTTNHRNSNWETIRNTVLILMVVLQLAN